MTQDFCGDAVTTDMQCSDLPGFEGVGGGTKDDESGASTTALMAGSCLVVGMTLFMGSLL